MHKSDRHPTMCRSVVVSYAHQNQLSECWECRPSHRGRRTSQCFKSHFFSPLFLSLSPHHFLLTLSHPLSFLICLPPSPSSVSALSFGPLRPSPTPVRCVAPPPAWSTGVRAGAWGWTTTPWRGWCPRRGDTADAETGTGVTVPHSAPSPDTPTQTRVSHS